MLKLISSIKKEYRDNIFIWNTNKSSMDLMERLVFHGINIKGFISDGNRFLGEILFNRPIVSLYSLDAANDVIVFSFDVDEEDFVIVKKQTDVKCFRYTDMLCLNDDLKGKKITLYGTGKGSDQVYDTLKKSDMDLKGYCMSQYPDNDRKNGLPVRKYKKEDYSREDAIIIAVENREYKHEIMSILRDCPCDVYVSGSEFIDLNDECNCHLFSKIVKALRYNKKLYLLSKNSLLSKLFHFTLSTYNISFEKQIWFEADISNHIESILTIKREDRENTLIVICEENPIERWRCLDILDKLGFSLENHNIVGTNLYFLSEKRYKEQMYPVKDFLVGWSYHFNDYSPMGCDIYGSQSEDDLRIMVLGGSTTAGSYSSVESWPLKLWLKIKKRGINVTVFNEGHEGNTIVQEILRFLRDSAAVHPHIVISLSGVNDTDSILTANRFNLSRNVSHFVNNTFSDRFSCCGIESNESAYDFWRRNQGVLKVLSENVGAVYFGFRQPMVFYMEGMSLDECLQFESEGHKKYGREFCTTPKKQDDVYIDLIDMFNDKKEVLFDGCHCLDEGNELIADAIMEEIWPTVTGIKGIL